MATPNPPPPVILDIVVWLFSTTPNADRWMENLEVYSFYGHFPGKYTFFDDQGFSCIRRRLQKHFRHNSANRLEYQFVLNHLGTFLIFPWHSFDYQARFWHIMVQLVASNGAKLLSQLIANTTFNLSEIAWKHPFFLSHLSPGHVAGASHSWDLTAAVVGKLAAVVNPCGHEKFPTWGQGWQSQQSTSLWTVFAFRLQQLYEITRIAFQGGNCFLVIYFSAESWPWLIRLRLELLCWRLVLQYDLGNCCCQIIE